MEARIDVTCLRGEGLKAVLVERGEESSSDVGGESGNIVWCIDLVFLLLAVALSAAEKSIPASSAFINARPGGNE